MAQMTKRYKFTAWLAQAHKGNPGEIHPERVIGRTARFLMFAAHLDPLFLRPIF